MDVRARIIEAAERLIAQLGLEGVSLRQIAKAAGSANSNAVRYHFGNRSALLKEIVRYRSHDIEIGRSKLLMHLAAGGQLHDGRALIEAYLRPLADMVDSDRYRRYASFLLALEQSNHLAGLDEKGPVSQEVVRHLRDALPQISETRFRTWLRFVGLMFVCGLVSLDNGRRRRESRLGEDEQIIKDMLDMAYGSLSGLHSESHAVL